MPVADQEHVVGPLRTCDLAQHQRIYRRQVVLGQAGVNIVGRAVRLRIDYRTTDEIRRRAVALLEGIASTISTAASTRSRATAHGPAPTIRWCPSFDASAGDRRLGGRGAKARTCLVARTGSLVEKYERALGRAGVATTRIKRDLADDSAEAGLRLATMHRVKGLEFDRVVIAAANEDVVP